MPVVPYHFLLLSMSFFGSMGEVFSCALSCPILIHARFHLLAFSLYQVIANASESKKFQMSASCCLVLQLDYQARGSYLQ